MDNSPNISQHLGFGCVGLSAMSSYFSARALLEKSYSAGILHYDTAPLYGRGYSEQIVGDFIRDKRQYVTIATKFGLGEPGLPALPAQLAVSLNTVKKIITGSRKSVNQAEAKTQDVPALYKREIGLRAVADGLHNSLKRLKTDYVDYYFLHEGIPSFLSDEAMDYLIKVKKEGKVRKIGLASNVFHLLNLKPSEIIDWDVLQYEAGNNAAEELLKRYSDKEHIHHSCLKHGIQNTTGIDSVEKGGYVLAACAKQNNAGKVLFSTKSKERLKQNIQAFEKYIGV